MLQKVHKKMLLWDSTIEARGKQQQQCLNDKREYGKRAGNRLDQSVVFENADDG